MNISSGMNVVNPTDVLLHISNTNRVSALSIENNSPSSTSPVVQQAQSAPSRTCWGGVFRHWSQYVFVPGILGLPAAGVSYSTGDSQWMLSSALLIAGVTSAIGFFAVRHFVPLKDFEDEVADLSQKVSTFVVENGQLKSNVTRLEEEETVYKSNLIQWKQTSQEAAVQLEQKGRDVIAATQRLQVVEDNLGQLQDLYTRLKASTKLLTAQIATLGQNVNDHLVIEISHLSTAESSIKTDIASLSKEESALKQNGSSLASERVTLSEFIASFESVVVAAKKGYSEKNQQIDRLSAQAVVIGGEESQFVEKMTQMAAEQERLERVKEELVALLKERTTLAIRLETLLQDPRIQGTHAISSASTSAMPLVPPLNLDHDNQDKPL